MGRADWSKYAILGVTIFFILYLALSQVSKDDVSIDIVDKDGNILAHESIASRGMDFAQAAGAPNKNRVRLSDSLTQAIDQPEAASLILSLKVKNDGNVPINVTLSNAMLVGGFR